MQLLSDPWAARLLCACLSAISALCFCADHVAKVWRSRL